MSLEVKLLDAINCTYIIETFKFYLSLSLLYRHTNETCLKSNYFITHAHLSQIVCFVMFYFS